MKLTADTITDEQIGTLGKEARELLDACLVALTFRVDETTADIRRRMGSPRPMRRDPQRARRQVKRQHYTHDRHGDVVPLDEPPMVIIERCHTHARTEQERLTPLESLMLERMRWRR